MLHPKTTKYVRVKVHVDDIAIQAVADDWVQVQNILAPAQIKFIHGAKKMHLNLSSKGVVSSSHSKLTKSIVDEMQTYGCTLGHANSNARDVGVNYTSGLKRPSALLTKRYNKTKNKFSKIKSIAKVS